jgi:arylsulfatase A-like enzyme
MLRLVALLILCIPAMARAADAPSKPNIVLVVADDLGYGDLGCYGQKKIPTPNIDRLAAEGMKFTNMYAGATVCAPSRCVLMTGFHGGRGYIRGNSKLSLRAGDVTIAELLGKAGYITGMFGKWGLGQESSSGEPLRQGFDKFYGYLDQHHAHNYYPSFLIEDRRRVALKNVVPGKGLYGSGVASEKVEYAHDLIFSQAMAFLDQHQKEKFFLYLPVTLPHANNEGKSAGMEVPDLGEFKDRDWPENEKAFAAMVARLDRDLGTLMAKLKAMGIDDETLVIFTSDNGPHAEGGHDPNFFDSNGPFRGIKRAMYDGGIHVPFLARWPGQIKPGTESKHIGYLGDIPATLCSLTGAKTISDWDSLSLAPSFLQEPTKQQEHEYLYWEFYEGKFAQAARMGRWKGVRIGGEKEPIELYDLEADPGEQANVAKAHQDIVKGMAKTFLEAHEESPHWSPDGKRPEDIPDANPLPPGAKEPEPTPGDALKKPEKK